MFKVPVILLSITMLSASGCTSSGGSVSNQAGGTLVGGVLGGALGSQIGGGTGRTAAIIGGTILGAYLGGNIGQSMDRTDQMYLNQTLESNASNQYRSWNNPDSGNQYQVTPTSTYYKNNEPCRNYTVKATIDGQPETVQGVACRDNTGNWVTQ